MKYSRLYLIAPLLILGCQNIVAMGAEKVKPASVPVELDSEDGRLLRCLSLCPYNEFVFGGTSTREQCLETYTYKFIDTVRYGILLKRCTKGLSKCLMNDAYVTKDDIDEFNVAEKSVRATHTACVTAACVATTAKVDPILFATELNKCHTRLEDDISMYNLRLRLTQRINQR